VSAPASPPVTFTETEKFTETFQEVVPCRDDLGLYTITVTVQGVFHVTAAGIEEDGDFHSALPLRDDGNRDGRCCAERRDGPDVHGRFVNRMVETELITHSTGTLTFSVRAMGSDGSRISFHLVSHYTINALGVEFGFEKLSC